MTNIDLTVAPPINGTAYRAALIGSGALRPAADDRWPLNPEHTDPTRIQARVQERARWWASATRGP